MSLLFSCLSGDKVSPFAEAMAGSALIAQDLHTLSRYSTGDAHFWNNRAPLPLFRRELSFAVDRILFGFWPAGSRMTNVLIHFGTTLGVDLCAWHS